MNLRTLALVSALPLFLASVSFSQDKPPASPHETTSATIAGKEIKISYGRPSLRGRKAVGGTLVPYGQVWRLGADQATKLTTPATLDIGGLTVPPGSYALFTLATPSGWKLIVNKTADQWGAFKYEEAQDLGRVDMNVSKSPNVTEQFTMNLESTGDRTGKLKLMWENVIADVPVTVKQ